MEGPLVNHGWPIKDHTPVENWLFLPNQSLGISDFSADGGHTPLFDSPLFVQECQLAWSCADLLQLVTSALSLLVHSSHDNSKTDSPPFIPDTWFLQSFRPLFRDVPQALGMKKGSCDVSIPFNFIVVYYFEIGSHCAAQNELDLVCGPHVSAYQGLGLQPHSHLSWKSWFFFSGLTRASYLCSLEQHNHLEFVNIGS